jgi:hypothetical protein
MAHNALVVTDTASPLLVGNTRERRGSERSYDIASRSPSRFSGEAFTILLGEVPLYHTIMI